MFSGHNTIALEPGLSNSRFRSRLASRSRSNLTRYEYLNFRLTVLFVQIGAFWLSGLAHFSWDTSLRTDNPDVAAFCTNPHGPHLEVLANAVEWQSTCRK